MVAITVPDQVLGALDYGFKCFLEANFESISTFTDDPLKEMKQIDPSVWNHLVINKKDRVVFVDYEFMINHLPHIPINDILINNIFSEWATSNYVEEGLKIIAYSFNEWIQKSTIDESVDKRPYEVRLTNFSNMKRITEISHLMKNKMISVTGVIVARSRDVLHYTIEKKWQCAGCGEIYTQLIHNREKEPKAYNKTCTNIISNNSDTNKNFMCRSKEFIDLNMKNEQPVLLYRIEALPEDTAQQQEQAILQVDLCDNLVCETYVNYLQENKPYIFTGIVKLREIKKPDTTFSILYVEIQSFTEIQTEDAKIIITNDEKTKIREFLAKPDSLEESSKILGKRCVGFEKEKKAVLLMRLLQVKFNRMLNAKPRDFLLHMLLCGDFGRGKSEFIEVIEDICERPVYLTASSTSGVGLAGSTIKDDVTGEYIVQSGAYSKASSDFLFLEEFDKVQNKKDLGILNEGMSKYQFTIAKANKYRKFKANTVVIMVANPILKSFDTTKSLLPQINISGDLLSRFSFISAITKSKKLEDEYRINEIMVKTMSEKIKKEDRENSIFLKKCLKVASENETIMGEGIVLDEINKFTTIAFQISSKIDEQSVDASFWTSITPRHRKSMIIVTYAVALWHGHPVPTKEDCKEANDVVFSFLRQFLENPELLNLKEIETGKTMEEIKQEIEVKIETVNWEMKREVMQTSNKKSKHEFILERIKELQDITESRLVDIIELKSWAVKNTGMTDMEFEDTISLLMRSGDIYQPRSGWIAKI